MRFTPLPSTHPKPIERVFKSIITCLFLVMSMIVFPLQTFAQDKNMLLTDHPLANTLWHLPSGKKLDGKQSLADAIAATDYLLLGEKHDNPIHHSMQATLLELVGLSGKQGRVVFEMVEPRHQSTLDAINLTFSMKPSECVGHVEIEKAKKESFAALGTKLDWEKRGWPEWDIYQGVFKAALDKGMSLHGGNPDRETLMSVARGAELGEELLKDLKWELDYSDANRESLLDELVAAHCGMMGREAMAPLVTLQRLKDANMARAMRQAKGKDEIAILIAGNGHTRKDRGVPMFLDKSDQVLSVAFIEVARGEAEPSNYSSFDPKLYDFVFFTPRLDEIDPCERFREQLKQMKSKMDKSGK